MSDTNTNMPADFPLNTIGAGVNQIALPEGPFDPAGSWQHRYGVYSVAGRLSRVGELRLDRQVKANGRVLLDMQYQKSLSGGRQTISAKIHLAADSPLSTPENWSFVARVLDTEGRMIDNTQIKKSIRVQNEVLTIDDACGQEAVPLRGDYTLNWALFDAIGRLPAESFDPIRFTLIDHFDQVKPNHTLSFRTSTDVTIRGKPQTLRAYDQLGEGIVPWVWWVDQRGRLLAAVSGLEVYLPSRWAGVS
jgi:hypothetical protein